MRIIKVGSLLESRNRLATIIMVGNTNSTVNAVNTPPPKDMAYKNPEGMKVARPVINVTRPYTKVIALMVSQKSAVVVRPLCFA